MARIKYQEAAGIVVKRGRPPTGVKILGEWSAVTGSRVFRLLEAENERALLAAAHPWAD